MLPDTTTTEHREMWRKFYQQVRQRGTDDIEPEDSESQNDSGYRNHGGGHRGSLTADMTVTRARMAINNLAGLEGKDDEMRTEIVRLMDELLVSIKNPNKPVDLDVTTGTESN